jgi:chromosome segregation ATPase
LAQADQYVSAIIKQQHEKFDGANIDRIYKEHQSEMQKMQKHANTLEHNIKQLRKKNDEYFTLLNAACEKDDEITSQLQRIKTDNGTLRDLIVEAQQETQTLKYESQATKKKSEALNAGLTQQLRRTRQELQQKKIESSKLQEKLKTNQQTLEKTRIALNQVRDKNKEWESGHESLHDSNMEYRYRNEQLVRRNKRLTAELTRRKRNQETKQHLQKEKKQMQQQNKVLKHTIAQKQKQNKNLNKALTTTRQRQTECAEELAQTIDALTEAERLNKELRKTPEWQSKELQQTLKGVAEQVEADLRQRKQIQASKQQLLQQNADLKKRIGGMQQEKLRKHQKEIVQHQFRHLEHELQIDQLKQKLAKYEAHMKQNNKHLCRLERDEQHNKCRLEKHQRWLTRNWNRKTLLGAFGTALAAVCAFVLYNSNAGSSVTAHDAPRPALTNPSLPIYHGGDFTFYEHARRHGWEQRRQQSNQPAQQQSRNNKTPQQPKGLWSAWIAKPQLHP